ncbi:MAG: class F sortase [Acidimicrobiia bacterium]|nr:class F sortase [Acidimicrobiia bacterium]
MPRLLLSLLLALVVACTGTTAPTTTPPSVPSTTTTTLPATTTTVEPRSPLADAVVPLGSAIYDPAAFLATPAAPVALTIEGIDVENTPIIPVGVEPNGEMEIPGAREVGWYRFGPTPNESGSSVLAAHIAWNGRNGPFRNLGEVEVGAIVTVSYDDGSTTTHVVTEIAQYAKDELPFDRVFAKTGDQVLTLITCGGAFNRSLNSYDDNIVVYARPLP